MEHGPVEDEMGLSHGGAQHRVSPVTQLTVQAETRGVDLPRNVSLRQNGIGYDFAGNGHVGRRIHRLNKW